VIRLSARALPPKTSQALAAYQREVDAAGPYTVRVAEAKRLFAARNTRSNATFKTVRAELAAMCSGAVRCAYCEDSAADEVEHVRPKAWFPELVFAWDNFVYACGPCNGPKGSRYAVVRGTPAVCSEARRSRDTFAAPPTGPSALIDPRAEDPLQLLMLDLLDTFLFVPLGASGSSDRARAEFTIDVLGLNRRDALVEARKSAFVDHLTHLEAYVERKRRGSTQAELDRRRDTILRRQHPTVWREMQRQQASHADLRTLFAAAPEALGW
jgi:uncharacterized protein (TIGR02646 family)